MYIDIWINDKMQQKWLFDNICLPMILYLIIIEKRKSSTVADIIIKIEE